MIGVRYERHRAETGGDFAEQTRRQPRTLSGVRRSVLEVDPLGSNARRTRQSRHDFRLGRSVDSEPTREHEQRLGPLVRKLNGVFDASAQRQARLTLGANRSPEHNDDLGPHELHIERMRAATSTRAALRGRPRRSASAGPATPCASVFVFPEPAPAITSMG